eukprot:902805-Rhodomonas_salina.6
MRYASRWLWCRSTRLHSPPAHLVASAARLPARHAIPASHSASALPGTRTYLTHQDRRHATSSSRRDCCAISVANTAYRVRRPRRLHSSEVLC